MFAMVIFAGGEGQVPGGRCSGGNCLTYFASASFVTETCASKPRLMKEEHRVSSAQNEC